MGNEAGTSEQPSAGQTSVVTALAPLPDAPMRFRLVPTSYAQAIEMAKMIAKSGLCPPKYQNHWEDVLICGEYGFTLGLSWMQALQNIAVISGRPSVWGDALLAIVYASDTVEKFKETFEGTQGTDAYTAVCTARRKGFQDDIVQRFSICDAKTAKLWGKTGREGQDTPWITHPYRMLKMRARGFVLRDGWADKLVGIIMREEAEDLPAAIDVVPQPDGSFGLDILKTLPEAQQQQIAQGFSVLEMNPAQQRVLVNRHLTDKEPAAAADAILAELKQQYAAKVGRPLEIKATNTNERETKPAPLPEPAKSAGRGESGESALDPKRAGDGSDGRPAGAEAPSRGSGHEAPARPVFDASF